MEMYFKDNQEIQEWIELFIEKLFTVSLLSGNDADSEYYRGCETAKKIYNTLKEMADLPVEVLIDGIHQLVLQRLPDPRVIENFPDFHQLMNEMIRVGIQNQLSTPSVSSSIPSSKVSLIGGYTSGIYPQESASSISLRPHLWKTTEIEPENKVVPVLPQNSEGEGMAEEASILSTIDLSGQLQISNLSQEVDQTTPEEPEEEAMEEPEEEAMEEPEEEAMEEPEEETMEEPEEEAIEEPIEEGIEEPEEEAIEEPEEEAIEEPVEEAMEEPVEEVIEEPVEAALATRVITEMKARDPFRFNQNRSKSFSVGTSSAGNSPSTLNSLSMDNAPPPKELTTTEKLAVINSSQAPSGGERLAFILKNLYPNEKIRWNIRLARKAFYAQVGNLLVYVYDTEDQENKVKKMKDELKKEGWAIFVCQKEDLLFSRRLERGIRLVASKKKH